MYSNVAMEQFDEQNAEVVTEKQAKSRNFACELCGDVRNSWANLRLHIERAHSEKMHICSLCSRKFSTKVNLQMHTNRMHTVEDEVTCPQCQKTFAHKEYLKKHIRIVHTRSKSNSLTCEICGSASFPYPAELKKHQIRVHATTRDHKCEVCAKTFKTSDVLRKHSVIHMIEKPFVCKYCQRTFTQSASLNRHIRTHTGEKNYACSWCDKHFADAADLRKHSVCHTDLRPWVCNECEAKFKTSAGLMKHKRTHRGEKPYQCKICGLYFSLSSNCRKHQLVHSPTMLFYCDHCSYATRWKNGWQQHMAMHEAQAKFAFGCEMQDGGTEVWTNGFIPCTIRCKTERDLQVHIQRNHTKEGLLAKLESEQKLAAFFTSMSVAFERDWANVIAFGKCKESVEGGKKHARIDFFLVSESARLHALVFVENDEYAHIGSKYACEMQRMFNISNTLQQSEEHCDVPIVFVRFNPHHCKRDGVVYSKPLEQMHKTLLDTIQGLQPEDIKPGVNLVYIHYPRTGGVLDAFRDEENDFAALFHDCVIRDV